MNENATAIRAVYLAGTSAESASEQPSLLPPPATINVHSISAALIKRGEERRTTISTPYYKLGEPQHRISMLQLSLRGSVALFQSVWDITEAMQALHNCRGAQVKKSMYREARRQSR